MATIERFEDIKSWQAARELVSAVYRVSGRGKFEKDFGLRDQIQRASVSVMANIAEGFERGSDREFHRFLYIAKGSAGEVRSHLFVALDLGYISDEEFSDLRTKSEEVARSLSGFITYLASKDPL
ncbi:MAG: four helix bundle protein [Nitrospira sp.]|nr:four helix bundle protein [Nitrospira sp.]TKB74894.1 MAG: four helix bundle protein [Nitrospira sp.]